MPVKKKDGRKRKGPAPATKAERKATKGNRGTRSREKEKKETPKKRKSSSPRPSPSVAPTRTPINRKAKKASTPPSSTKTKEDKLVFSPAFKLAAAILSGCPHGTWWRLTPDPLKRDDISVGSRQCWDNILPTFIDAGLFGTRQVDELGIEHRIEPQLKQFDIMATYLEGLNDLKLQWTCVEPRRGRKSWHIILSDFDSKKKHPYSNPIAQQMSTRGEASLSPAIDGPLLRNRKANDKSLTEKLDMLRRDIETKNLLHRMKDASGDVWEAIIEAAANMGTLKSQLLQRASEIEVSNIDINDPGIVEAASEARNDIEEQIKAALKLDFDVRLQDPLLRPSRCGTDGIKIGNRKQADERMRSCAVFLAEMWGYRDGNKTWEARQRIAKAVCNQIAYDHGYPKSTGASQLGKWYDKAQKGIATGNARAMSRSFTHTPSYTDRIEKEHPGYLHELYRYAIRTRGILSTFSEIAETMNSKSATSEETRPVLKLHRLQVYRWFKKNKGKELSAKEKPILTDELKRQRVEWVRKWGELFKNKDTPVCYLDEKWFYTSSRRRKIKYLPPGPGENQNDAYIVRPKIRSRRFPVKVMYLGVVARPFKDEAQGIDFNGRVALKRVSREKRVKRMTSNQKFSPDVKINDCIKKGEWKSFYVEGMTAEELIDIISEYYDLSKHVTDRLELNYTFNKQVRNARPIAISRDEVVLYPGRKKKNSQNQSVAVTLNDLNLCVRYQQGDTVEEDVTCDSQWMKDNMDEIAQSIRDAYHWVKDEDTIYLVMDNAGGHGTDECVKEYTQNLLDKYNIEIVQQVARSPETNVLDLGIWMSLQSSVEKKHKGRCCNPKVLNKTVMEVWEEVASVEAFENVFGKLPMIYNLILRNLGGNDLVETNRGKKGIAETHGDANEEEFYAQPPLFPGHNLDEEEKEADDGNGGGGNETNNITVEVKACHSIPDYVDYSQGMEDDVVEDEDEDDFMVERFI